MLRRGADNLSDRAWARLLAGIEAGDERGQVACAWVAAQELRAIYRCVDRDHAAQRLYGWTVYSIDSGVAELRRLARTISRWREEFLAYFTAGRISNGPTEAINLLIKKIKRVGHGFRNFSNYRVPTAALRNHLAPSKPDTTTRPTTTLGCVEPDFVGERGGRQYAHLTQDLGIDMIWQDMMCPAAAVSADTPEATLPLNLMVHDGCDYVPHAVCQRLSDVPAEGDPRGHQHTEAGDAPIRTRPRRIRRPPALRGAVDRRQRTKLLSASMDHTLRLWPVPARSPDAAGDALCAELTHNMSPEQRNDLVSPKIPYVEACPSLPRADYAG